MQWGSYCGRIERGANRQLRNLFAALGIAFVLLSAQSLRAQSAYVRVNQAGYVSGSVKRAYLMSSGSEAGATFSVQNSSLSTVYSAPIGADKGVWGTFAHVYALDFDSVSDPETYTITVTGPTPATSPGFRIDSGANLYSVPLANALSYYQNSRDGANFIPSPLRSGAGHLNDQNANIYFPPTFDSNDNLIGDLSPFGATTDASGGWWDAGDYLKFVETHSYTVALMLLGVRDFPSQMGPGGINSDFTAEARFGLDWLQKMWNDSTQTLYYQVGIGQGNGSILSDHDIWRLPQVDDTFGGTNTSYRYIRNRPVFLNPAGGAGALISPNLAGRLAADFAACYQVFKASDPAYANQCLLSAEHVFDLANTSPSGNLVTVAPFDFYGETEWRDDMELGATELYLALAGGNTPGGLPHTDPMFYLQQASNWAHAYIISPDGGDTLNLYDVSGLAHFELARAIQQAGVPAGLAVSQTSLLSNMKSQLDSAVSRGSQDPFGFGYIWTDWDTTTHGTGLSVMASEYAFLTGNPAYTPYSSRWLSNVLGANAWGASFILGIGSVFPNCIQHQVANIVGALDGTAPVLVGAAVEGPNGQGSSGALDGMRACNASARFTPFNGNGSVFVDNVQSYSTVEPAIDLTASSPLAFSWQFAAPPGGPISDFSLSRTPTSRTISVGAAATYSITVAPLIGFASNVSLSISGLPTSATASFSPSSFSNGSGSSTLTVSTTSSTPPGSYTLTIQGTSSFVSHSTSVTLIVSQADFSLSATPSSRTINAGSSTTYSATVSPTNGFNSSVALSASGLPAGTSAAFSPSSISGGSGTSTLTVSTTSSTPPGSYPVTIQGTSGALIHSAPVTLIVNPRDFSLSATPLSRTIGAGSATTYSASVTPTGGFNSSVSLSVSGLPTGAAAAFSPSTISNGSGSSTLSVSTAITTPPGTYTLTISGTSGSLAHSTTVTLNVNPPPPPDFSLTATPSSQSVRAGSGTSFTGTVTPLGGFSSTVAMSVSGLPTGVSASFSPGSISGGSGSSTLSVSTASTASSGTYTITIIGTSGALSHTTTVTLTISRKRRG